MRKHSATRPPIVHGYRNNEPEPLRKEPGNPPHSSELKPTAFHLLQTAVRSCSLVFVFGTLLLYPPIPAETDNITNTIIWDFDTEHVTESVAPLVNDNEYPELVRLEKDNLAVEAVMLYNFNDEIKQYTDGLLYHYKPDYAAVVVIQPRTGQILALSSFVRDGEPVGNLTVHSDFPAASLFKIVTAAAVIDQDIASPDTIYEFNGKDTSLYKKNVLRHKRNKWTRSVSLSTAFGRSINTVFGRMGVFDVGRDGLIEYARLFGFDQPLPVDMMVEASRVQIEPENDWSVAEAASGYTKSITMSPVHAAMMVAAIVNDGVAVEPRLIKSAHILDGSTVYSPTQNSQQILDASTADDMRVLMRKTVTNGSARKRFRGFFKGRYADLDVGGKTGSLTGVNPRGRTEWFAGYADSGKEQIAVAAVVVNKEKWRVKPSTLARKIIEEYFEDNGSKG